MNSNFSPRALRHLGLFLVLGCISSSLSAANRTKSRHAVAPQGKPSVQQVDPPNWWSNLPNPMLLMHGKNLGDAHITCSVAGVSVRRMKISQNGHWAFVWLDTSDAPPQHFDLILRTAGNRTLTATDGGSGGPALAAGVSGLLPLLPNNPTRLPARLAFLTNWTNRTTPAMASRVLPLQM